MSIVQLTSAIKNSDGETIASVSGYRNIIRDSARLHRSQIDFRYRGSVSEEISCLNRLQALGADIDDLLFSFSPEHTNRDASENITDAFSVGATPLFISHRIPTYNASDQTIYPVSTRLASDGRRIISGSGAAPDSALTGELDFRVLPADGFTIFAVASAPAASSGSDRNIVTIINGSNAMLGVGVSATSKKWCVSGRWSPANTYTKAESAGASDSNTHLIRVRVSFADNEVILKVGGSTEINVSSWLSAGSGSFLPGSFPLITIGQPGIATTVPWLGTIGDILVFPLMSAEKEARIYAILDAQNARIA